MTQPAELTVPVTDDMLDFTRPRPTRRFRIDADVFEAKRALSARTMLRAVALNDRAAEASDADEQLTAVAELAKLVLTPESADLFIQRLGDDDNPIEIVQINELLPWFLSGGADAQRPTTPSGSSSTGSNDPGLGTSSTASAHLPD